MLKKIKKIFTFLLSTCLFFFYSTVAFAENTNSGLGSAFKSGGPLGSLVKKTSYSEEAGLLESLSQIITGVLSILGLLFIIYLIYGGFIYLTARGNEESARRARAIITRNLIGLIVTLAAYTITYFVLNIFL